MPSSPETNPYLSPADDEPRRVEQSTASMHTGERIGFHGKVNRLALVSVLRGRLSWAGLGTLLVGALICLAASPEGFLTPFTAKRRLVDPLSEQMGLVGLGFVVLAVWHVIYSCTGLGLRQKERYLLRQDPDLYSSTLSGAVTVDYFYLNEHGMESWLCWPTLNHLQIADQVMLMEWGSGATGTTVLTLDMFANGDAFERAAKWLRQSATHQFDHDALSDLEDFFLPDNGMTWPDAKDTLGECEQNMTYGDGTRSVLWQIPVSIFRNSVPLHAFFLTMLLLSAFFSSSFATTATGLVAIWASIVLLAMIISLFQTRHFLLHRDDRLMKTRTRFTQQDVHITSTVGYFRIAVERFVVRNYSADEVLLELRNLESSANRIQRSDFRTNEEWVRVRELFQVSSRT